LGLFLSEQRVKSIKAEFPARCTLGYPLLGVFEASGSRADYMFTPFAAAMDQPGSLKHSKVPRYSRRRDAKWFG
jgi:hypothetical protein